MSDRLCCYKQQQYSKLLAQFVFKVCEFRFNTRTKTRAKLHDCRNINNALIKFVPSCQDTRTQYVDVLDPPFSYIACSISHAYCLVVGIFVPKNSTVTKFCHLAIGGPVIMPHRVVSVWRISFQSSLRPTQVSHSGYSQRAVGVLSAADQKSKHAKTRAASRDIFLFTVYDIKRRLTTKNEKFQ